MCSVVQDDSAKAGKFGFPVDNTIGGTPQENGWMDDWVTFFRERRLKPQLARTKDARLQQMGKKLCDNLGTFFEGVEVCAPWNVCVGGECGRAHAHCGAALGGGAGAWLSTSQGWQIAFVQ